MYVTAINVCGIFIINVCKVEGDQYCGDSNEIREKILSKNKDWCDEKVMLKVVKYKHESTVGDAVLVL